MTPLDNLSFIRKPVGSAARLTGAESKLLDALLELRPGDEPTVAATSRRIAEVYGCTEGHVRRTFPGLERAGYVSRVFPAGGRVIRFNFTLKPRRPGGDEGRAQGARGGRAPSGQDACPGGARPSNGGGERPARAPHPLSLNETSGETQDGENETLTMRSRGVERTEPTMTPPAPATGPTEAEVAELVATARARRGPRKMAAALLKRHGRLPADLESDFADVAPAEDRPPDPPAAHAPPPPPDHWSAIRAMARADPGQDLARRIARRLRDWRSIPRFRQVLGLAEADPELLADVAGALKAALGQDREPPRRHFGMALAGLVPAQRKPPAGDLLARRPGGRPERQSRPQLNGS